MTTTPTTTATTTGSAITGSALAGSATEGQGTQTGNRMQVLRMLAPTIRDIAVPVVAYFGLHALGASDFTALLAGAVVSGVMVLTGVIQARKIDAMGVIVLGGFAVGLIGSLISGDARTLIVRDSFGTAVVGLAFLISAMLGKPLTYAAIRKTLAATDPAKLAVVEQTYRTNPAARRLHVVSTVLWGVALTGEAALRVVLAYQLPVHTMAWLSSVLMVGTISVMVVVTAQIVKRLKRQSV
ncbi:VC0807 family protein [Nocardia jejuensis]|uniref:VC0807 family protein n=1 Tax=Nocardia jejuensis TaxID=328049 RepID=UPI00082EE2C6|nr:VC0807 family protein [Nocardia jejuensis]